MGFLDKAKSAAEQATTRVKEGVDDVQAKRSLSQAYEKLGEKAFELIEKGELSHPDLTAQSEEIRSLRGQVADDGAASASTQAGAEAPAPTTPS
jgi:hypothetical protein